MALSWTYALIGGVMIGLSASVMLIANGRITGISGIINGAVTYKKSDTLWRLIFLLGLFLGGLTLNIVYPASLNNELELSDFQLVIAGLLVGFGTVMGAGCTSGHGVCGISRLSTRSIVATVIFILAGVLSVHFFQGAL